MVGVPLVAGLMGRLQADSRHLYTIQLFVVHFVFLCLSYYCTFVHTLVLSKVAGRQLVHIAVVCDAFLGFVSIPLRLKYCVHWYTLAIGG